MSDGWEVAHGLNPANALDGNIDSDGDGLLNREECVADTHLLPSNSVLRITGIAVHTNTVTLDWQGGTQATR